jgi:hypothetical protein
MPHADTAHGNLRLRSSDAPGEILESLMKFVIAFLLVVAFCQMIIHCPAGQQERFNLVKSLSAQEKKDSHKLVRKHGQDRQIFVIYYEGSKAYFRNEKGEKYLFK